MTIRSISFILLCFAFMGSQTSSYGQASHELKTDLLGILFGNKTPNLYWELNTQKRWAFSLGARYTFSKQSIYPARPYRTIVPIISEEFLYFKRQWLTFSPAVHFYFSKKNKNYGWYSGLSTSTSIRTYLDPAYLQTYYERNQNLSTQYQFQNFFIGIPGGYKWLVNDCIVLELTLVYGLNLDWWQVNSNTSFSLEMTLKTGYRFPTKNKKPGNVPN